MKFIDQISISVKAGDGGNGCIAFLREKFRPKGGPCGGDGGSGGSIFFQVDPQLVTLQDISMQKHYVAENGEHGKGKNMHGKKGKDVIILVPPGTVIKDQETEQILYDLVKTGDVFIAVKGGNGGFGNARFKTKKNTAPRIANDGQAGEVAILDLELKILADIGLVGFPNAGKSTFISRVSNARPKVADYPFTTLVPNLGIVKFGEYKSFVLADIPGLIEGASDGKGLGSQFLRHIERTKAIAYIIDSQSKNLKKDLNKLKKELKKHNPELLNRQSLILLTKSDLILDDDLSINKIDNQIPQVLISSVDGFQINTAIKKMAEIL